MSEMSWEEIYRSVFYKVSYQKCWGVSWIGSLSVTREQVRHHASHLADADNDTHAICIPGAKYYDL